MRQVPKNKTILDTCLVLANSKFFWLITCLANGKYSVFQSEYKSSHEYKTSIESNDAQPYFAWESEKSLAIKINKSTKCVTLDVKNGPNPL